MTSDTYHVYSAHPYLHPAVGIPDALVLLVDEASCSLYDLPGTVTACLNAGLHMTCTFACTRTMVHLHLHVHVWRTAPRRRRESAATSTAA